MMSQDLLIIDDFGLMGLDINKCRNLFEILDGREGEDQLLLSPTPYKKLV